MRLRPYQSHAIGRIREELSTRRSTLAVLATGCGKTIIFSHMARGWPGRVLILAHRDELIQQAREKLVAVTGEDVGVEMGESRIDESSFAKPRLVVSSVQTMCRPRRQAKFDPSEFGLVVVDEAHHAVSRTYREVLDHFGQNPETRTLGVTATPKRADQLAMGQVFESVAIDYGIEPAVEDGWLVPVRQQAVTVEGLDFSGVRSVAGDLSEADLERVLAEEKVLHAVAAPTVEIAGDLPSLVFCVTVAHARLMAEVLNRYKPHSAVALDGSTPREERRGVIERFKAGDIQFLVNCALFLEGFDAPSTALVVMARPTKSLALYAQVLGRGTRPLPGVVDPFAEGTPADRRQAIAASAKPWMLALDFVGNSGRHRIVTAADLLGGKYGEPVRAYARKTAEQEGAAVGVEESLERARDELALVEEIAQRKKLEAVKARAEYAIAEVSPFSGGARTHANEVVQFDPPSPGQRWFLTRRLGWTSQQVDRISKRQASAIIGKAKEKEAAAS